MQIKVCLRLYFYDFCLSAYKFVILIHIVLEAEETGHFCIQILKNLILIMFEFLSRRSKEQKDDKDYVYFHTSCSTYSSKGSDMFASILLTALAINLWSSGEINRVPLRIS